MNSTPHVLFQLVLLSIIIGCIYATSVAQKIEHCKRHCVKVKKASDKLCQVYCEGGHTQSRKLEIFDDGVPVTYDSLSDEVKLNLPQVRFDKALFNTPSAFDELVKWTDVLKQQVAVSAESVFGSSQAQQFHMLPMPIPLTGEQLSNQEFMNRLLDVVPDSNLVYKETSPLTFSEAYKQFLLDVKVDGENLNHSPQSPEITARIHELENSAQHQMNLFLEKGDRCFAAYEQHLIAHNLKRIAYTFDSFGPTNQDCVTADQHMAEHARISAELSSYMSSVNPNDELFRAIASQTHTKQDWNFNRHDIDQFTQEQDAAGGASASAFKIALNMAIYYLKQEVFGTTTQLEESCLNAHVDFSAHGWREIDVSPKDSWFSMSTLNRYRGRETNSGKNYFQQSGLLQRMITKVIIASKPVLKFTVTKAMKERFIEHSVRNNLRLLEFGPTVYDRVEFKGSSQVDMIDAVEMVITSNTRDPQVIGYKTASFDSLSIPRVSTGELAFCRRESACDVRTVQLVPIHSYFHMGSIKSFYTTNYDELGGGKDGWTYRGVLGYCYATQVAGTVPIYRYNGGNNGRLYTNNWDELGHGRDGYGYEGVMCYVHTGQEPGTVPMHRYYNAKVKDRAYPTDPASQLPSLPIQQFLHMQHHMMPVFHAMLARAQAMKEYNSEGVVGYIHTQSAINQAIACCRCQ